YSEFHCFRAAIEVRTSEFITTTMVLLENTPNLIELWDALTTDLDIDEETCLIDVIDFITKLTKLGFMVADSSGEAEL
ncbi:MAG: hypothetical protein OXD01_15805, partial [Gammaproteobacteria bacterium]|nr:hypothetical protein [Gammaproteobacteria bacterium]